jgi:quercetin dioxygenase-like cupin family protein
MSGWTIERFSSPDEKRPFQGRGSADVLSFQGRAVLRATFEPGWRWSENVQPLAGTRSCETFHAGYILSGRMRIRMDDGQEEEVGPGDALVVEPGHDAWVLGEEACVMLDFGASEDYARAAQAPLLQRPDRTSAGGPGLRH